MTNGFNPEDFLKRLQKGRPSPEELLKRLEEEERKETAGKLKIYLGSAPGVGKTHAMLKDALVKRVRGLDVLIGVVESHGRPEIERIAKEFEILPRQKITYRGIDLLEFNLEAAIKRQPALILMDEFAHRNGPNLRHPKRWMDIRELLDRGIDVYTTLNVQHIESLNDYVSLITGVPIKETIPNSMIEVAHSLYLIDLPTEELLKRLQEGKIYIPTQAKIATEHFFREGNLIALRELALRVTAEWVRDKGLAYRQRHKIKNVWPTKEKIAVCISPEKESIHLLREAKRLAGGLQADWLVLYVETPNLRANKEKEDEVIKNLLFAEQFGAKIYILKGEDIVREIITFSQEQNVTLLMLWKHIRSSLLGMFSKSLTDAIIRNSGEIDVYIMTHRAGADSDQ